MIKVESDRKIQIREEYCKECGLCLHFCPENALEFSSRFNSKGFHPAAWKGECRLCGVCCIVCPDCAIEVK